MKKLIAGMTAVLLAVVSAFPVFGISASSAILIDGNTGRVLYEKNAGKQSLIASTTKIMTALVVCEQCNVLDRMRIPAEAVGIEGSSMYLRKGEVLTLQELLYGLMLRSGNDAAVALAIYCGGTVEGFAELMNDKAHSLGMKNTHFENPNGLDSPAHYSTAEDMAILTRYAMQNPIFARTVSTKSVRMGERVLQNHNKLLWRYPGADGVKTGFTKAAGRILVSSACRQGRRLIAVTMNDPDDWNDHAHLLDKGFEQFRLQDIVAPGDVLGELQVAGGREKTVKLIAKDGFNFPLARDEKPRIILHGPGFVYAPVAEGQDAGTAHVMIGDQCAGKIQMIYGKTVEMAEEKSEHFWKQFTGRNHKWKKGYRKYYHPAG